MKQYLELFRIY